MASSQTWPAVQGALARVAEIAIGIPNPIWVNEKAPGLCPPFVEMQILGQRAIGVDEERQEFDPTAPAGQEIKVTIVGQRAFTWQLIVETMQFGDNKSAWQILERARTRLRGQRSQGIFRLHEMALVRTLETVNLDYQGPDFWMSRAAMDVQMSCAAVEIDCSKTYIEKARIVTKVADVNDDELSSPPNRTQELP